MNPFDVQDDFGSLLKLAGQDVLINNVPAKALITNYNLIGESEDRNIHTVDKVTMGDLITFKDESFVVIKETVTQRHAKYKTLMRHCNHQMQFPGKDQVVKEFVGYDSRGRPIYKDVIIPGEQVIVPAILSTKTFSIDERYAIRVQDKQIVLIVQDNEFNRGKLFTNSEHLIVNGSFKVIDIDLTLKGLLICTLESIAMPATIS